MYFAQLCSLWESVVVLKGLRYFTHFQVIIAEKLIEKIIITGQITIAVHGEYFLLRFQVIINNKS